MSDFLVAAVLGLLLASCAPASQQLCFNALKQLFTPAQAKAVDDAVKRTSDICQAEWQCGFFPRLSNDKTKIVVTLETARPNATNPSCKKGGSNLYIYSLDGDYERFIQSF